MGRIRSIGIDPGSMSWDMVCLDGDKSLWQKSVPTESIKSETDEVIGEIENLKPDVISAPSGYGLPLTEIRDLDEERYFEITVKKRGERTVMGLLSFLDKLRETGLKSYILPSVKHLQTVPVHRKINKIDMGTPDKICSAAYSMHLLNERYDIGFDRASLIHCEIGYGFNAFIAIEGGKIIDGIGGSISSGGNLCPGMLDMELAYLRGGMGKDDLVRGGCNSMDLSPEIRGDYLREAVIRDIHRLLPSVTPEFIIFSFRNRDPIASITREVMDEVEGKFSVIAIPSNKGDMKISALGSAMIANGLGGGVFQELVDVLEIKNSGGSIFDFIYPPIDVSKFIS